MNELQTAAKNFAIREYEKMVADNTADTNDWLNARNRAFGAIVFIIGYNFNAELLTWWNDEMVDKFNAHC